MKKPKKSKDQTLIEILTENSMPKVGEIIHVGSTNNSFEYTSLSTRLNKALDILRLLVVLVSMTIVLLFILLVSIWK